MGGVQTIGQYSLEVYVGNVIAMNIVPNLGLDNRLVFMLVCILMTAVISPFVIGLNAFFKKIIK